MHLRALSAVTDASFAALAAALVVGAAHAAGRHEISEICGECVVEKFATCGGFLEGATFDRSGTLWVVDLTGGKILRVDGAGQCHAEATPGGAPNGAKFHRDGRLFIADKNLGVVAYDPSSKKV